MVFQERAGKSLYEWQLDVAEAFSLGLDVLLLAGTGAGKTSPFMVPLLVDPKKTLLIVLPLKLLQDEQVSTSMAVNGDTWTGQLEKVRTSHIFLCYHISHLHW